MKGARPLLESPVELAGLSCRAEAKGLIGIAATIPLLPLPLVLRDDEDTAVGISVLLRFLVVGVMGLAPVFAFPVAGGEDDVRIPGLAVGGPLLPSEADDEEDDGTSVLLRFLRP